MNRFFATAAATIVLVACHSSVRQVTGPDGSKNWYSIQCSRNPANCMERAGEVCPKGYDVEREDNGASEKPNNLFDASQGTHVEYEGALLIRCRD